MYHIRWIWRGIWWYVSNRILSSPVSYAIMLGLEYGINPLFDYSTYALWIFVVSPSSSNASFWLRFESFPSILWLLVILGPLESWKFMCLGRFDVVLFLIWSKDPSFLARPGVTFYVFLLFSFFKNGLSCTLRTTTPC